MALGADGSSKKQKSFGYQQIPSLLSYPKEKEYLRENSSL
jgi:hypothetical protein